MSTLIQARNLGYSVANRNLFQALDLTINEQEKIGLVGYNGTGKSTLLALLAGELSADDGEVTRRRNMVIATVEQFLPESLHGLSLLMAALDKLSPAIRETEAYRAEIVLGNLNFKTAEFDTPVSGLSGGQQNRLMIARALISEPDLILFDEPTNHLDLTNLLLLENFLQEGYHGAFLMVSHDREMLDKVTNKTLFLRDQKIYSFDLPYTKARQKLTEHDIAAAQRRESEERKIESLRSSAKRLAMWGKVYDNEKLARKAKSMEKRVERMEGEKTFVTRGHTMQLDLDTAELRAKRVLHIENKDITVAD
ncbi:MAG: ATP-binding cassette domain-containing protein, partial [Pseudomonadota bacterium]